MDEKCAQLWTKLSAALKPQVSADTFKRWFSAVKLTSATADELTLLVPNNIYQFWIESINAGLQSRSPLSRRAARVSLSAAVDTSAAGCGGTRPRFRQGPTRRARTTPGLNPRNTCGLLVGPNNEIAPRESRRRAIAPNHNRLLSEALGLADAPAAIGNTARARQEYSRDYLSRNCSSTNPDAIRQQLVNFRKRYPRRSIDRAFFHRGRTSQEEFFHTATPFRGIKRSSSRATSSVGNCNLEHRSASRSGGLTRAQPTDVDLRASAQKASTLKSNGATNF